MRRFPFYTLALSALILTTYAQAADPPSVTAGATQAAGNTNNNNNNSGSAGANQASPTSSGVSIPATAAAGGLTVTDPVQTADASYYKIAQGVSVTFGWNFTSIVAQPTSLTVQAYCSENGNTYNIGPATGLPGTATSVVWSPYDYSMSAVQNPNLPQLIAATYRLLIYDERGLDTGITAGRMSPNTKVTFALYNPQAYTPLASGWVCAACSGAGSLKSIHPAFIGLIATMVVMVASGWSLVLRGAGTETA